MTRNGGDISLLDLFGRSFVLLAGGDGEAWCEAARNVAARLEVALEAFRVGGDGPLADDAGRFDELYGTGTEGAVLVRPDGFVAWRAGHGLDGHRGPARRRR